MGPHLPETVFKVEGHSAYLYALLAQTLPPRTPDPKITNTAFNPAYAASLLAETPTVTVPPETLNHFEATDFPLLLVTDPNGILRVLTPVTPQDLQPGGDIDAAIAPRRKELQARADRLHRPCSRAHHPALAPENTPPHSAILSSETEHKPMAKGVNKVFLLGNVGKDPEIRATGGGTTVASFGLATAERTKDQQGNWVDKTEWHNLVAYGRTAEIVRDYVKKAKNSLLKAACRRVPGTIRNQAKKSRAPKSL